MTQSMKKPMLIDPAEQSGFMYANGEFTDVVTPIMVDLNDLFDDRITIVLDKYVKKQTKLAVNVATSSSMHGLTGTVLSVRETAMGFETVLEVDYMPDGLLKDLEEILSIGQGLQDDPWE